MNLLKATGKLVGVKYVLGSMDTDKGLDCFSLIINYLRNIGYNIPDDLEFKGHTLKDYGEKYSEDPNIINIACEYLTTILQTVPITKAVAGDILFACLENNAPSFGIDGGNGTMVIVSESGGVQIIDKKHYTIKQVLRCRRQSPPF